MHLIPGDSPMGYRLPLDSLPWEPVDKVRDRIANLIPSLRAPGACQTLACRKPAPTAPRSSTLAQLQGIDDDADSIGSHRYGCASSRALAASSFVFMPPQEDYLEDYLDLIATIEATSANLGIPVQIEGYEPPRDSRLQHFKITPPIPASSR